MKRAGEFKKKMAASFSGKAEVYDRRAGLQKDVAALLRERLKDQIRPGLRLLDVGCGTGLLSLPLATSGLRIHAVDMARGMVAKIRQKTAARDGVYPAIGDGEFLPYANGVFDLVLSSLTYHWIFNLPEAFREVRRVLKDGGFFSIALSGRDSLMELRAAYASALAENGGALPPLMTFPGTAEVEAAIAGPEFSEVAVESRRIVRTYPDFWEFLRSMKAIGAGNPYRGGMRSLRAKSSLEAVRNAYHAAYADSRGIRATYEIIFCSGRKASP
jgi:malonyl-CoA O-methyltransferase